MSVTKSSVLFCFTLKTQKKKIPKIRGFLQRTGREILRSARFNKVNKNENSIRQMEKASNSDKRDWCKNNNIAKEEDRFPLSLHQRLRRKRKELSEETMLAFKKQTQDKQKGKEPNNVPKHNIPPFFPTSFPPLLWHFWPRSFFELPSFSMLNIDIHFVRFDASPRARNWCWRQALKKVERALSDWGMQTVETKKKRAKMQAFLFLIVSKTRAKASPSWRKTFPIFCCSKRSPGRCKYYVWNV